MHIHHAAASAVAVPRELRPAPAHFTGRDRELAELDRIAAAGRERDGPAIAVISGPGGVGKSALELRWMHGVADRFPDGQLYVDLGSPNADEPASLSSVLAHLLRAMGVPGELISADVSEAAALFRSVTANKRIALLIENPVSAAQVRTVLPASPASVVVVASRWRLGGLALDGAEFLALEPFQAHAGAELLARTVGDDRVSQEPGAMASLVELCGGLPIALAIVGARLVMRPGWSLARVVRDLTDERRRLAALSAEQDVSVHGVFDLSYENLTEPLARAYRWLGLHPGPNFSVDVAAALLDIPVPEASDLLETLVDASLLEIGGEDRYQFHDLVRLHARQHGQSEDSADDRATIVRRTIEHYLSFAVEADRGVIPLEWHLGPRYQQPAAEPPAYASAVDALDSLESELPNLMAALRAGVERRLDELVWQLCEAMYSLFLLRKHFPDWMAAYRWGIDAADRCGDQVAKSRMHHHLGIAFHNLGRSDDAVDQGVAALTSARTAKVAIAESEALNLIGMANRARGRHGEAIDVLRQAVDLDQRDGRLRNEALGRRLLGQALMGAGLIDDAIDELRRAHARAAAVPDVQVESDIMVRLADALTRGGHASEAIDLIRVAWLTLDTSGSSQYRAQVLMVWGEAAERLGDLATAGDCLTRARDLYAELGLPHITRVQQLLDSVEARQRGGS